MQTVLFNDKYIKLEHAKAYMDEEIIKYINAEYFYDTDQDFFDDYIFLHQKIHGKEFIGV